MSQCNATDGSAYSGYNETGFSIVNSHSYNMPNSDYGWNALIMQMALERCATVDEFEYLLSTLSKPISVCANYGVMDAQGNVSIIEVGAYTHVRYNADDEKCGYLIRKLRTGGAAYYEIEEYNAWVDNYIEKNYAQFDNSSILSTMRKSTQYNRNDEVVCYDILGRRVQAVKSDAIVKKNGNTRILLK